MKFFLFALFLFPSLAQATPITFLFRDTNDQMTNQSTYDPALSDLYLFGALGDATAVVNLVDYNGEALNSKDLPLWLDDEFLTTGLGIINIAVGQPTNNFSAIIEPPGWLMLGAGFIGLAVVIHHRRK